MLQGALLARPEVTGVRHPGLPTDPGHKVAAAQMRRFGATPAVASWCIALSGILSAAGKTTSKRYTFVIDKDGKIVKIYDKVDTTKHPKEVLEFVKTVK